MEIKLYDTMSRKMKSVAPSDGKIFRFYCCGPTVYGPSHIGNFRAFLLQDVLRRLLEVSGLKTYHIRNITDVDDKTIRQSQSEGKSLKEVTEKWTDLFHNDCKELNMLPPHKEPRASGHIPQQIELVRTLLDKGHAYQASDGSVYFKISTFPDYGKLTHLDRVELKTQSETSGDTHNLADEYERETVADFSLWKARKENDGDNYWASPWGEGRPGWHLECSAMSMEYLGESFDLHGGGIDICFPHHENEIAQSESATGNKPFSRHWFHNAHLMVEGKKMSKSLGNLYTLEEIKNRGETAMALRYLLISGHYRQPLNFTFNGIEAARSAINKLEKSISELLHNAKMNKDDFIQLQLKTETEDWGHFEKAWEALVNDLNTPACLGNLFSALNKIDSANLKEKETSLILNALARLTYTLGLELFCGEKDALVVAPGAIRKLADERWVAKQDKDFTKADELRERIQTEGWQVHDRKDTYDLEPV
jgi:cysteinyl-tRNA synthetase